MEGLKVVWSLLTKPSDKGIETSVSGEALPGCMLPVQIEQFGRLWAPPPADFGQQSLHPSEEGWARLLICRDRSRAGSGCNLTFQARCLPGCSGSCGHGIPGAEPHSTGRARCGGGSGSLRPLSRGPSKKQPRKARGRSLVSWPPANHPLFPASHRPPRKRLEHPPSSGETVL